MRETPGCGGGGAGEVVMEEGGGYCGGKDKL